jgi:hypothetical protein
MSVSLAKFSDHSIYGGHSPQTSYEKDSSGNVPGYVLSWRRAEVRGSRVSTYQALRLMQRNSLNALFLYYAGRL